MSDIPYDILTPTTLHMSNDKSVLVLTADKVEDLEFFYPYYRFVEEGCRTDVVTPKGGYFKGKNGYKFESARKISEIVPDDYNMLFIPGGKAPEELKKSEEAVELVRHFFVMGKPIAAICHGPQLLAAAGVIDGASISGWPEIGEEVLRAGGIFTNRECQMDGQFITARWPADLPTFMQQVLDVLSGDARMTIANPEGFYQHSREHSY
jgi:protease I